MKTIKTILILCMALCFATSCKKEVDMTLVQKTVYEHTDISMFHVDDAWEVTFVYDSLNSFVELEYSAYMEEHVSVMDTNNWLAIGFRDRFHKETGSVFKATVYTSVDESLIIMAENTSIITMEGHFDLEHINLELRDASVCDGFAVSAESCSLHLGDGSQMLGAHYSGTDCSVFVSKESSCKGFFDVAHTFNASVYHQSQLVVFGGTMNSASIEAKNAFTINMAQAEVENMYVHLSEISEATVNVANTITGFLLSGSTLYYKGHPQLEVDCDESSSMIPF